MSTTEILASNNCSFARMDGEQPGRLLPPVPNFPVHVLPEPGRSLAIEGAAAIGVPPDLIAVPLLGFVAGAVGRSRRLVLKKGWEERAVLDPAVVAPPGSAKTPALRLAQYAAEALQKEAHDRYQAALQAFEAALALWEASDKAERGAMPVRPVLQHIFTNDATMEAMALLLCDSSGLVLVQDELVGWIKSFDAYRTAGDRQRFLSLWSSVTLKVDRKGTGTLYVPDPALTVVGGVKPDLLPELHNDAGRRDGFVERILWSRPHVAPAAWSDQVVADATRAAMVDTFRRIVASSGAGRGGSVQFDDAAKTRWVTWFNANCGRIATTRGIEQGILAKLPSQAARLALVLHCLGDPDGQQDQLSDETLGDALELAEYFLAHARLVLPAFSSNDAALDSRVLGILDDAGSWISRRDLHQRLGGHVKAAALDEAIELLVGHGLVEEREVQDTGGRPAKECRILAYSDQGISFITK